MATRSRAHFKSARMRHSDALRQIANALSATLLKAEHSGYMAKIASDRNRRAALGDDDEIAGGQGRRSCQYGDRYTSSGGDDPCDSGAVVLPERCLLLGKSRTSAKVEAEVRMGRANAVIVDGNGDATPRIIIPDRTIGTGPGGLIHDVGRSQIPLHWEECVCRRGHGLPQSARIGMTASPMEPHDEMCAKATGMFTEDKAIAISGLRPENSRAFRTGSLQFARSAIIVTKRVNR